MIWKGILEYIQKEQRKDRAPALGWSEHSLLLPLSPAVVTEWCLTSVLQVLWSCRSCSQTPSPAHCMWFSCLRLMEERQSAGGASSSEMKKCLPVAKGGVCFRRCINANLKASMTAWCHQQEALVTVLCKLFVSPFRSLHSDLCASPWIGSQRHISTHMYFFLSCCFKQKLRRPLHVFWVKSGSCTSPDSHWW